MTPCCLFANVFVISTCYMIRLFGLKEGLDKSKTSQSPSAGLQRDPSKLQWFLELPLFDANFTVEPGEKYPHRMKIWIDYCNIDFIIWFNNPLSKQRGRVEYSFNETESISRILIRWMPQGRGNLTGIPKLYSNGHLISKFFSSFISTTSFLKQIGTL